MSQFKQKLILLLLCLLAILATFSVHPVVAEMSKNAGIVQGSILSRYIIVVFAALFLLTFRWKETMQSKTIRTYLSLFLVVALFSFLTYGFFLDTKLFGEIRALFISFAALSVGWQLRFSDKQIRNVFLVYAISAFYVGLLQVFTSVGGFVIEDQYLVQSKNSLGVMLASSIAIFSYLAVEKKTKKIHSVLYWGMIIVMFAVILTIRARTATLVAFFIVLLVLYRKIERSHFTIILIFLPLLLVLGYLVLPSAVKEYVVSSFVLGYEGGDITSQRSERNISALSFLSTHLLLGNLRHEANTIGWIHNYPLLQLFNNGLLFGLPILTLYCYLFGKIINEVFRCKVSSIREAGFFALLVPFIVSMAEPTFPFGPGTATVFNFIIFGIAVRYKWEALVFE